MEAAPFAGRRHTVSVPDSHEDNRVLSPGASAAMDRGAVRDTSCLLYSSEVFEKSSLWVLERQWLKSILFTHVMT